MNIQHSNTNKQYSSQGRFKITSSTSIFSNYFYYFSYRIHNGIMEIKADNSNIWSVGSIPSGAILI